MTSPKSLELVASTAVTLAVLNAALFAVTALLVHSGLAARIGAAVMGADEDQPTDRWASWLARLFLAVFTTAGLIALVADHPAVWQLAPGV